MPDHPRECAQSDAGSRAVSHRRNGAASRDEPHFGKILDMVMLALPGGEERNAKEYEALLAKADFKLTSIVPTHSTVSVIEAVKA